MCTEKCAQARVGIGVVMKHFKGVGMSNVMVYVCPHAYTIYCNRISVTKFGGNMQENLAFHANYCLQITTKNSPNIK